MTKGKTKVGHIFFKTTSTECAKWGGFGICDECNQHSAEGYLVPVLNLWLCPKCFESWQKRAIYYSEDRSYEENKAQYYESILKCE